MSSVWFLAVLLNLLSVAAALPKHKISSFGTVYCPLTKRFQPIKAVKHGHKSNICSNTTRKLEFEKALIATGPLGTALPDDPDSFEKLVFSFFEKGVAAVFGIPFRQHLPDPETRKFEELVMLAGSQARPNAESSVLTPHVAVRPPTFDVAQTSVSEGQRKFFRSSYLVTRRSPRAPPVVL